MALTNRGRVEQGLDLLRRGLAPFIDRELNRAVRAGRLGSDIRRILAENSEEAKAPLADWDAAALLRVLWQRWNDVFRETLGATERSLVSELRGHRNQWAHQKPFSGDDAYRALDSAFRLLTAVSAPEAQAIEPLKTDLLRARYEQERRNAEKCQRAAPIDGKQTAAAGLASWREVISPHEDVASGRYRQAEFAADLWQVSRGEGAAEYRDPKRFFHRTFLTESLRRLLLGAVRRLGGAGGDPVVALQTSFGGGKTHSMLALYHLFSGTPAGELAGVDALLAEADLSLPAGVRRAVLVGHWLSPSKPQEKPDGVAPRTLWGELAWQLGGKTAYERIRRDDENATNPGDGLVELLRESGPALVLVDEWVAYARQLREDALPGGTFETQFSFAQTLTEAAKRVENCLLVVALPASDRPIDSSRPGDEEVGGLSGREALSRLQHVIGRVASPWRPASSEESFAIVRRRLFESLPGHAFQKRNLTARSLADFYRSEKGQFPPKCREADYEKRIQAEYPIHPEVFDRLYDDWSALARFQRTRGVLRLMAAAIHSLWESGDQSPLILPSMLPIDDPRVQPELTRYLTDNWTPILEKDVDGPNSLPRRIDSEFKVLGAKWAARRVARTIFLGSAPKAGAVQRGLDDQRVRLGCALPGDNPAVYDDALRRLAGRATHLYREAPHSWYDTQPTVTKLAEERAEQLSPDLVSEEVARRARRALGERGRFAAVHSLPASPAEVADQREARLVALGVEEPHLRSENSPAQQAAAAILESRGSQPRQYRNALLFLSADAKRVPDLEEAVRAFLAWKSITAERETLNLNVQQARQAENELESADSTVAVRLPEVWRWLLCPNQEEPSDEIVWEALELRASGGLVERAEKRAVDADWLLTGFAGSLLRRELDRVPLWRGEQVPVRQLADDFAQYLYLPRLVSPEVLAGAVRDGLGLRWAETFAFADGYDEDQDRYLGLRAGQAVVVSVETGGLLVKPERARRQFDEESAPTPPSEVADPAAPSDPDSPGSSGPREPRKPVRRYHGTVRLDPLRVGAEAGRIAEEVIAHLAGPEGASVRVSLEIEAEQDTGFSERVVRAVRENATALQFESHEFETE